jgi:hypothetical protein
MAYHNNNNTNETWISAIDIGSLQCDVIFVLGNILELVLNAVILGLEILIVQYDMLVRPSVEWVWSAWTFQSPYYGHKATAHYIIIWGWTILLLFIGVPKLLRRLRRNHSKA